MIAEYQNESKNMARIESKTEDHIKMCTYMGSGQCCFKENANLTIIILHDNLCSTAVCREGVY